MTSANFGASKIVISDIDNTNVIVIALSNTLPKKANVNKITIVYSNAALIKLNAYVTTIEWQRSNQKSRYQYSSKPSNYNQQKIRYKSNTSLANIKLDNNADTTIEREQINRPALVKE